MRYLLLRISRDYRHAHGNRGIFSQLHKTGYRAYNSLFLNYRSRLPPHIGDTDLPDLFPLHHPDGHDLADDAKRPRELS
jgi:hypothetical protein